MILVPGDSSAPEPDVYVPTHTAGAASAEFATLTWGSNDGDN